MADDRTDDDTEDQDVDDDHNDTDAGSGDDQKPPPPPDDRVTRAESQRKKANAEAMKLRRELAELKAKGETADQTAAREAAEKAAAATEGRYKPLLVNALARAAFVEAGAAGKTDRLVKMLDLDAITVDDGGELEGLDVQIKSLKADFPELFGRGRAPAIDAGPKRHADPKRRAEDAMADFLLGKS